MRYTNFFTYIQYVQDKNTQHGNVENGNKYRVTHVNPLIKLRNFCFKSRIIFQCIISCYA